MKTSPRFSVRNFISLTSHFPFHFPLSSPAYLGSDFSFLVDLSPDCSPSRLNLSRVNLSLSRLLSLSARSFSHVDLSLTSSLPLELCIDPSLDSECWPRCSVCLASSPLLQSTSRHLSICNDSTPSLSNCSTNNSVRKHFRLCCVLLIETWMSPI